MKSCRAVRNKGTIGRIAMNKLLLSALIFSSLAIASPAAETRNVSTNSVAQPLPSTHVHNLFRATTNVFSGNSPDSDAAYAELAQLGVKTIISVDGAKPDAEAAREYGMRYIHLPIGYDSVPSNRVVELVKAAQTVTGPIYVHCHHGKHRGPAAVAVICEATAGWTTNQAVTWLKEAGTATDYGWSLQERDGLSPARSGGAGEDCRVA